MDFTRKRKRGMNGKTEKVWFSPCNNYRITWRREIFGVTVPAHFHACVRAYADPRGDMKFWHFAGRRGAVKKFSQAVEACEKHQRIWNHAIEISEGERKGRGDRLRAAVHRSRVGSGVSSQHILATLPVWVRKHSRLVNQLFPKGREVVEWTDSDLALGGHCVGPSDPIETSPNSETASSSTTPEKRSSSKTQTGGPASNAEASGKSSTRTTRRSTAAGGEESPAQSAEAPAAAPENSSRPSTTGSSPATSRKSASTKRSRKPKGRRSKS